MSAGSIRAPKVLVLGANGQVARYTTPVLLEAGAELTLFLRRSGRLANPDPARVRIVEGDVLDPAALKAAMQGQDVVYANLAGDMAARARSIVDSMHDAGLKRLIFISSMGIYGEVPGEKYRSVLDPCRDSAEIIEASDLDYTILRPGWFNREPSARYRLSKKGEPFIGHASGIVGIMSCNTLNLRFVARVGSDRMMLIGTSVAALAALVLLVVVSTGWGGWLGLALALFAYIGMNGLIGANTIAGGLSSVDKGTGSASALLGFAQYGGGMIGSALVSTFANGTPWPMALIICVGTLCAGTITWSMNGRRPTR